MGVGVSGLGLNPPNPPPPPKRLYTGGINVVNPQKQKGYGTSSNPQQNKNHPAFLPYNDSAATVPNGQTSSNVYWSARYKILVAKCTDHVSSPPTLTEKYVPSPSISNMLNASLRSATSSSLSPCFPMIKVCRSKSCCYLIVFLISNCHMSRRRYKYLEVSPDVSFP